MSTFFGAYIRNLVYVRERRPKEDIQSALCTVCGTFGGCKGMLYALVGDLINTLLNEVSLEHTYSFLAESINVNLHRIPHIAVMPGVRLILAFRLAVLLKWDSK